LSRRFFPSFLACDIRVFLEKIYLAFFPPSFWLRYSSIYKKTCSRTFSRRFFSIVFCLRYTCVSRNNYFSRFFPPFFGNNIYVFLKIVFSHFFKTIFFHRCLIAKSVCFWKNFFYRVFSPFLVTIFKCL